MSVPDRYGKNYKLPIEQFLSPAYLDACARIVHLFMDGTDREYRSIEIPAYIFEKIGISQERTRAIAEKLWQWLEENEVTDDESTKAKRLQPADSRQHPEGPGDRDSPTGKVSGGHPSSL